MTKAMLIGCGRFSGFQDPGNLNYYFGALKKSKIKLETIYDIDFNKSKKISKKFNLKTSNNLNHLCKKYRPEFIIISSAIKSHYKNIKDIMKYKNFIKLIIIEKPLVHELKKFKEILTNLKKNNIKFVVNHTRRFDKNYSYIKNKFTSFEIPKAIQFNYYGKWINHGIHMIATISLLSHDRKFNKINFFKKDNIFLLKLYFVNKKVMTVYFKVGNDFEYQTSDIDIYYEKKKVQILNHGETYIYYSIKKNLIGEIELKKDKKLNKINNFPLVNMLRLSNENFKKISNMDFLKKDKILDIYSLFFKIEKYIK